MSSNRLFGLGLLLLMAAAGCTGTSQSTTQFEQPPETPGQSDVSSLTADPGQPLNPQVGPPPLVVEVAPDLVGQNRHREV